MKYLFYFEVKDLYGGMTSLYITLFEELTKRKVDFLFFNFEGGVVQNELRKIGIEVPLIDIENYDWNHIQSIINPNDLLVITSFYEGLTRFNPANPRVLYYAVHEFIAEISAYKFGLKFRNMGRKLVEKLDQNKSLIIIDDTAIRNCVKKLNYKIKEINFLPVPVKVPTHNSFQYEPKEVIKMSYIGRSVDWKMYPLKKILEDLLICSEALGKKILFSIVVDSIFELKKFIEVEKYQTQWIDIQIFENIKPVDLKNFVLENSHIGFAMGTAALDYGKLGVPVILVDFGRKEFPVNYEYNWLFDSVDFSLGKNLEESKFRPGMVMDEMMKVADQSDFLAETSKKTYHYVKHNHSVEHFVDELQRYNTNATFRLKHAQPYVPFYFYLHKKIKVMLRWLNLGQQ